MTQLLSTMDIPVGVKFPRRVPFKPFHFEQSYVSIGMLPHPSDSQHLGFVHISLVGIPT